MVLLNKAALSSFDFHAPTALLFFQCLVCCFLVRLFSLLGLVRVEPWYVLALYVVQCEPCPAAFCKRCMPFGMLHALEPLPAVRNNAEHYCMREAMQVRGLSAHLAGQKFMCRGHSLLQQAVCPCALRRSFKIAQVWIPVNVIFVGMIWTSFFALKNLGVPMATVLKNLTNLFTIGGDYLLYGKVRSLALHAFCLHSSPSPAARACPSAATIATGDHDAPACTAASARMLWSTRP